MLAIDNPEAGGRNHPLAPRMAAIAFLNQNITIACVWGSFSVLLTSVEARLGVGRELSTLAVPIVNLATAIFAPLVGALATRHSLRLVMLIGTALSIAGFATLALTSSYPVYLFAYGALLGPGMAVGAVLPASLVTRWYAVHRGRALGIVCIPLFVALVPLASNWCLEHFGIAGAYAMLAALSVVPLLANLFIIDRPPSLEAPIITEVAAPAATLTLTTGDLLRSAPYWALAVGYIASITGSILLTAHMVPMAGTWGYSSTSAATLLAIQAFAGMGGTVLFGWIADKLGGAKALALLLFDGAVLWLLLLTFHASFYVAAVIIGLIGMHAAGAIPALGVALSERFGRDGFSRAYGLINLVNLPFSVTSVPAAAMIFARTGSYAGALLAEAVFLGAGALLVVAIARSRGARSVAGG